MKKNKSEMLPGIAEIKKLWQSIPPREWFNLLCEIAPQHKWTMVGQSRIKGCCPYHNDTNPSFFLEFNKGFGKCFGSCEKFVTDLVGLTAKLNNSGYTQALMLLQNRFNLDKIFTTGVDLFNELHVTQEAKKATAIAANKVISEVIRDNPSYLAYCKPAVDYLLETRKLPMETITNLPIGVFAKPEHLLTYVENAQLHPVITQYFEKYQSKGFWGSLMFHYNDSPGTISRFKFRMYDFKHKTFGHDFIYAADKYSTSLGVYGLHKYARRIGANETNAYITEGEFDVLSVMAQQDLNDAPDFMIFGTGGKGGTNINFLAEYGIKTIWVVPDHPAKSGGDAYAVGILSTKQPKQLTHKIFQWPIEVLGLDLDEAVQCNTYKMLTNYLVTQKSSYFMNATPWIISKCNVELENTKHEYANKIEEAEATEKDNLKSELKTHLTEVLLRWFALVQDPADKVSFTNTYTNTEGIDISQLSQVSNAMYSLDTYDGVVHKVHNAFLEHFSFAYYQAKGGENMYSMWVKQKRVLEELKYNDRSIASFIALHVGVSLPDWLDRLMPGNPIYYEGIEDVHTLKAGDQKAQHAARIINHAFSNAMHLAQPKADLSVRSQGIHYADLPAGARRQGFMYFINGKKVFRGVFTEQDVMEWELLENVVDTGILFESLCLGEEWSFVDDVSDLYSGVNVDLLAEYEMLKDITGAWKFQHDDIIQEYMPAYIMSLPIMRACNMVNMTYVTGSSQSGKTSLVHGLLGGTKNHSHKVTPLLESAEFSTNTTSAAFYQSMDGKANLFILDEAEKSSSHNTHQDDNTADLIRILYPISQGGSDILRGGTNKDLRVSYHLHLPVLLAAINMPTDTTFLSRVMIVQTCKEMGRQPPENYIGDKYDDSELDNLRHNITVGLLNKVPSLIRHGQSVSERLMVIGRAKGFVSNRFLNSVLLPITIYDYIGAGKAEVLYGRILEAFKDRLMSIHYTDAKSAIIDACLYMEGIKYQNTTGNFDDVSAKALITNGDYGILNASDSGVYIMVEEFWIVLVWKHLKYTVLRKSPYANWEEAAMREAAIKSKWAMQEVSRETHARVKAALKLKDVKSSLDYTIMDADYLIEKPQAEVRQEVVMPESIVEVLDEPIRKKRKR